jgi:hypothetical protein
MKIIFLVLKTFVLSILFLTNSTAEPLVGHFNIVTARYASDVATTLPGFGEQDSPIGQTITFHTNGLTMEGLACEQWQIIKSDTPSINLNDPILADLTINPTDSHLSSGEHRLLKNYSYLCEGEAFIQAFQIDAHVIVIPWANSSQYLIAETPLTLEQMKQFQKQLKSMKFYSGDINGQLDDATLDAINLWVSYRLKDNIDFKFLRPIITENLLDSLGVLNIK